MENTKLVMVEAAIYEFEDLSKPKPDVDTITKVAQDLVLLQADEGIHKGWVNDLIQRLIEVEIWPVKVMEFVGR